MCLHCYKLASEEARHSILRLLKSGPMNVGQLTKALRLSQPTVTHHLKLLTGAKLVRMEKKGREHHFSLELDSECYSDCGLLQGLAS